MNLLREKKFLSSMYMMRAVGEQAEGFDNLIVLTFDEEAITFSYKPRHKAIQRKTNKVGYIILLTNSRIISQEVLKIYRGEDRIKF